jgi:hypothetical protein
MLSLIILTFGLCDHIDKVQNFAYYNNLCMIRVGYYYHSVNLITLNCSQSDHIKQLTFNFASDYYLPHQTMLQL